MHRLVSNYKMPLLQQPNCQRSSAACRPAGDDTLQPGDQGPKALSFLAVHWASDHTLLRPAPVKGQTVNLTDYRHSVKRNKLPGLRPKGRDVWSRLDSHLRHAPPVSAPHGTRSSASRMPGICRPSDDDARQNRDSLRHLRL